MIFLEYVDLYKNIVYMIYFQIKALARFSYVIYLGLNYMLCDNFDEYLIMLFGLDILIKTESNTFKNFLSLLFYHLNMVF